MLFLIGAIAGFTVGLITSAHLADKSNPYSNPNHTPLADAEMRRISERYQDYHVNPVVEHMKRTENKN